MIMFSSWFRLPATYLMALVAIAGIGVAVIGSSQLAHATPGACAEADGVVSTIPGTGLTVPGNPLNALGADGAFYSLGHGGQITLSFSSDIVIDGDGEDLLIIEVQTPEGAEILLSADGVNFVSFGTHIVSNETRFDISSTGLASFKYVRLIDDNVDIGANSPSAGFDLDAIEALNCGEPEPTPTPTATPTPVPANPSVDIEKATNGEDADVPTGPSLNVGDAVNWTYVVTNTGDVTLFNLAVSDDQGVAVTCPQNTLGVGNFMTCTGNGTAVEGQYANVGTVNGEDGAGTPVTDSDPSHYIATVAQVCTDPNPERDLTGEIVISDDMLKAWGTVHNISATCSYDIGIASYKKFDEVIDNQIIFDWDTGVIPPASDMQLHVDNCPCAAQIDLFYGEVLMSLDGQRYGTRKLDWIHIGGSNYCDNGSHNDDVVVVTDALPDGKLGINFQPSGAAVPAGYVADSGSSFGDRGNGQSYGWNQSNGHNRDRNSSRSEDQRFDTLNHLQKSSNPNASWELKVDNGRYEVRIVAGDPSYTDSNYRINVEDMLAIDGVPTSSNRWFDETVTVDVTDGRLTITNASGAHNNKIAFIVLQMVDGSPIPVVYNEPPDLDVKVNFQNGSASVPSGYLKDKGRSFREHGNGHTYGWNQSNFYGRDRNNWRSADQRYDTLNHMQKSNNPNGFWEFEVENGTYEVFIVAGDSSYTNSVYKINVEGSLAIDGTPTNSNRWFENTVTVEVTDGRLTISSASGSSNNKLSFIHIIGN